jgi:hypothetical protein
LTSPHDMQTALAKAFASKRVSRQTYSQLFCVLPLTSRLLQRYRA